MNRLLSCLKCFLFSILAIQTGGCSIAEIGLSYFISFLLTKIGLERTFQILAAVFLFIGLTSSQLFFSTNYQNEGQPSWKSKGYQVYFKLLKNKPFGFFLFAMAILSFTYSVSSVHQVNSNNDRSFIHLWLRFQIWRCNFVIKLTLDEIE